MERLVDLLVVVGFIFGVGIGGPKLLGFVKRTATEKVLKGLSKSEPFAQSLTGKKLPF